MGGGGVGLLDWRQLAVVAAPVNSLGVGGALEILLKHRLLSFPVLTHIGVLLAHLVDAVPEAVGDAAHDGSPHLAGRHLPELNGGGLAVKCGVWRHNQVWCLLQGGVA